LELSQQSTSGNATLPTDPLHLGRKIIPGLDGLRGVAILLVLIIHYASFWPRDSQFSMYLYRTLGICTTGVQLFFVLSGFLITGILLDSKETTLHYFRNFYMRRFLRIFPLYYAAVAIFSIYALALAFGAVRPGQMLGFENNAALNPHEYLSYLPWLLTYTSNFWSMIHNELMHVVGPYWTLAIEEQFYLVWPLLVFFLPRKAVLWTSIGLVLVSALWWCLAATTAMGYTTIYVATPAQVNALGAGAMLAVMMRDPKMRYLMAKLSLPILAISGVIIVFALASIWTSNFDWFSVHPAVTLIKTTAGSTIEIPGFSSGTVNALLWTVIALFYAALLSCVLFSGEKRGFLGQVMSSGIMTWFGRYSYGIYILHVAVMFTVSDLISFVGRLTRLSGTTGLPSVRVLVSLILTCGLAYLSYHLFEKRFLALKRFFPD